MNLILNCPRNSNMHWSLSSPSGSWVIDGNNILTVLTHNLKKHGLLKFQCHFLVSWIICFKGPYADHILIHQGSSGSSTFFLFQIKAHICLVLNPKFQLQILCSFGDMTKKVKFIGIPENNFLCIFIIATSPRVHTFFCIWRENKKLPRGETSQNAFQRSRSVN